MRDSDIEPRRGAFDAAQLLMPQRVDATVFRRSQQLKPFND